jgi:ribosomal subunit interface protein
MQFQIRVHDVHVDDSIRDYAEEKIGKAVRKILGSGGHRVDIEFSQEGHGAPDHRVAVHLFVPHGKPHVVSVSDPDMKAAIDVAADKIGRSVRRATNRRRDRARKSTTGEMNAVRRPEEAEELDA